MPTCIPPDSPDAVWPFCPSPVPAVLFAILFGTLTIAHFTQAIVHRKAYCWVMIIATLWQTTTYVLREVSVYQNKSIGLYSAWFVMILIAPLWINAFVYMIVARMVWCFLPTKKLCGVWAWKLGTIFVCLDIIAFIVQVGGASMASGNNLTYNQIMLGLHIYMIGVGIQQIFIIVFTGMLIRFQILYKRANPHPTADTQLPLTLVKTLYAVLALITVRIIFRLVEYSRGYKTGIPTHEAYTFVFESFPMFIAVVLLAVVHPGRVMPGKQNQIPSRKERKHMMREGLLPGKGSKVIASSDNSLNAELGLTQSAVRSEGSKEGSRLGMF